MPVFTQPVLPRPSLALRFVFVEEPRWRQGRLLKLVSGFIVLSRVPLALAGGYHCNLVSSCAAILALQLDALGTGLVIDAPPVLIAAPSIPEPSAMGSANPVFQHLSWETLACTHQLLDGVDAGAVTIRDVLSGPQFSASNLTLLASVVRRAARSSPADSWTVHGDVALDLRHRGAHVREQELSRVVLEGLATPQQDAKQEEGMARLVRAEMHGCVWGQRECVTLETRSSRLL